MCGQGRLGVLLVQSTVVPHVHDAEPIGALVNWSTGMYTTAKAESILVLCLTPTARDVLSLLTLEFHLGNISSL